MLENILNTSPFCDKYSRVDSLWSQIIQDTVPYIDRSGRRAQRGV